MTQPREKRVVYTLPVSLEGSAVALSTDISKSGFCLESTGFLPEGSEVRGVVMHGPLRLAFTGRVARATPSDPMTSTWHTLGVRFVQLSPGLRALLGLAVR